MALTRTNIVPAVSFPGNTNRMPFLLLWVWPIVFENRIDLPKSYPKSADSDSFFYEAVIYIFILKRRFIFLSIPLPGFVPSDRFAWNGPVRLSLISSVLLLLGKTKDFVFLSLIRRTH